MTTLSEDSGMTASVWRPFIDDPILTPAMTLGWDSTAPEDRERLSRYLYALVTKRRAPVHVNVAFNAVYFGYSLNDEAYVSGPDLSALPRVSFDDTTAALPVGTMIDILPGGDPLLAEVVYKEGADPALRANGDVPDWLSGAPAGVTGPGKAEVPPGGLVSRERLVLDFDAFGQGFSATPQRLDRIRRRGWLDPHEHLLLNARYASRQDADLDETAFYALYLLTSGRGQLLGDGATLALTAMLSDDAGEEQLSAALAGIFGTVAGALAHLPELKMWRGYAFTGETLDDRLHDPGALGGGDLDELAAGIANMPLLQRRSRWRRRDRTVIFTAVGPRLRAIQGSDTRLMGVEYALAVCHANAVISEYARREVDEATGLLRGDVHLRLDDPRQGGGVWRAERPDSVYRRFDVAQPLGLGWLSTLPDDPAAPTADAGPFFEPEAEDDDRLDELTVTDSQLSWTVPLRLKHLLEGQLPVPDAVSTQMRDAGLDGVRLRLQLAHDGRRLERDQATQTVDVELFGHPRMTGIEWPLEFFAGIMVTCVWGRGASAVRATTTLLDQPVTVDGSDIEYRYDPRILTRDGAPGEPRRSASTGQSTGRGGLSLPQRVLRAVRRLGHLDPAGRAMLARSGLSAAVGAAAAELDVAVDELMTAGALHADLGGLGADGRVHFPLEPGESAVPLVVYEPHSVPAEPRSTEDSRPTGALDPRFVRKHLVAGHLRRIGQQEASDQARQNYQSYRAGAGLVGPEELPPGHTFVRPHSRGGS